MHSIPVGACQQTLSLAGTLDRVCLQKREHI